MATYIALLHKDADSDFAVTFPDFPGCVSAASNLDGLRRNAAEALALHIEGMIEDGDEVPEPTSLDDYTADPETDPKLPLLLVSGPQEQSRSVRVNVMLPERLLADIDQATGNRSRFLAEAARAKLRSAA